VGVAGTPQGGPWDVRLRIVGTGNRGTATFQYSTTGGSSWSGTLTTAATVPLGATGLIATFGSVNYESTAWAYGALVSHFHQDGAAFTMSQADNCSNNKPVTGVTDTRMNYLPSIAPAQAGGKSWVVFTSRRMYGNTAYEDPWDAEPGYSCYSGKMPSKKLWVAAIDDSWTPGSDPSHPAFYLPGQELAAGNSDGYWVSQACKAVGADCESDDDCCGGTGATPQTQCRVQSTATFPPVRHCENRSTCAPSGSSCQTSSDCCTGLVCPTGGGLCVRQPPLLFGAQSFEREYVAECPAGTEPTWRFTEWQATIPAGTSIEFFVQSRQDDTGPYQPMIPELASTATATTLPGEWQRGPATVDQALVAASSGSQNRLLVTVVFNPDPTGMRAPTLLAWRQIYDCLASE
jgi:hypothetical protein